VVILHPHVQEENFPPDILEEDVVVAGYFGIHGFSL